MEQIPTIPYSTKEATLMPQTSKFDKYLEEKQQEMRKEYTDTKKFLAKEFISLCPNGHFSGSKTLSVLERTVKSSGASDFAWQEFLRELTDKGYKYSVDYDPDDDTDFGFHFCRPTFNVRFK